MYEALAAAIDLNHGSATDVKTSLEYAANLAQKTHNPNHLVSVADRMMLKGLYRSRRTAARRGDAARPSPIRAHGDVDQSRPEDQRPRSDGRGR